MRMISNLTTLAEEQSVKPMMPAIRAMALSKCLMTLSPMSAPGVGRRSRLREYSGKRQAGRVMRSAANQYDSAIVGVVMRDGQGIGQCAAEARDAGSRSSHDGNAAAFHGADSNPPALTACAGRARRRAPDGSVLPAGNPAC